MVSFWVPNVVIHSPYRHVWLILISVSHRLRCDRKQPCSSCASRDLVCTYVPGGDGIAAPTLHDRLLHLERLIKLQIPASKETETAAAPSYDIGMAVGEDTSSREPVNGGDVPAEHGRLHIAGSDSRYVGGEHWAAILESITDFRDQLEKGEERALTEPSNTSSSLNAGEADPALAPPARRALLLYACPRPASRDEILAALPPKVTVDRYLSRYFTYLELASCMLKLLLGLAFLAALTQLLQARFTVPPFFKSMKRFGRTLPGHQ